MNGQTLTRGAVEVDARGDEVLSLGACLRLLTAGGIGRLALTVGALPTVVPVGFVATERGIVVADPADAWFRTAAEGAVVAFEADEADAETGERWSVVVVGVATALDVGEAEEALLRERMGPWADAADHGLLIIAPGTVSGRRASGGDRPLGVACRPD